MRFFGIQHARQQGRNIADREAWERTFELIERNCGSFFRSRFILGYEAAHTALIEARKRGTLYPHEREQAGHKTFFLRTHDSQRVNA